MDWTSILVAMDADDACPGRLRLACGLARAFGARLVGVAAEPATPPPLADPMLGSLTVETLTVFREAAEAELAQLRSTFLAAAATEGLEALWRGRPGFPADVIKTEARTADLIVMGRRSPLCDARAADPGDVLLGAGRPVLVVPPSPARDPLGAPAIVAWSDTGECRRAVSAALPLLIRAGPVSVAAIAHEPDEAMLDGAEEAADWLRGHGVDARAELRQTLQEPADEILDLAVDRLAGLIVAGGYGHARLREWILGGVTRSLLGQGDVCVLMAH